MGNISTRESLFKFDLGLQFIFIEGIFYGYQEANVRYYNSRQVDWT